MAHSGPTTYQDRQILIRAYSRPVSLRNGDWWGWFRAGSRMAVFIADAAGRDEISLGAIEAAKSAILSLQRSFESGAEISRLTPGELVRLANAAVFQCGGGQTHMTFFACVVNFELREMAYANAGHCPPWLIAPRDGLPGRARLLASAGPRLGEGSGISELDEHTISFQSGDTAVFYTDGLTNGPYGSKRPRKLIESYRVRDDHSMGASSLIDALLQDFLQFNGGKPPSDDLTLLSITATARK